MFRITAPITIGVLALALTLTFSVEEQRLQHQRAKTTAAALAVSNMAAERDSTRSLTLTNARIAAIAGDSLRIVAKRAVQLEQQRDAVDNALGTERRSVVTLDATIDSLVRGAASATTVTDNVRIATFDVRQAPYTVHASVALPLPPDSATIALRVALDPIHVETRIECSPQDQSGVSEAVVTAQSSAQTAIRFDRVEQSPGVCQSPQVVQSKPARRFLRFSPLVLGGGRLFASSGAGGWGLFVGTGILIWI